MRLENAEVLLAWPLAQHLITAGWTYNDGSAHRAIDLRAAAGTPVYAAEDGTVDWTQDWDGRTATGMMSYGTGVRIQHADYRGGVLQTRYAHLSKRLVRTGEQVTEGQLIGYSGRTGSCLGAHLHFEVIWRGVRRNPLAWLDGDFACKNRTVAAHLGAYTSVARQAIPAAAEKAPAEANGLTLKRYTPQTDDAAQAIARAMLALKLPIYALVSPGDAYSLDLAAKGSGVLTEEVRRAD